MSSRSLGADRSRVGEKYVLGAERSPRSARLRALRARTAALPGRYRSSEAPDGGLQRPLLRGGLALPADAGGVGLPARPLKD